MSNAPKIIHEDDQILIVDKPAGMPTVDATNGTAKTLERWLIEHFPAQKKISKDAGLVNRIDNDTSGIVVIARTPDAYNDLKEQWKGSLVLKEYESLVVGQIPAEGEITAMIAHHPGKSNKMLVVTTDEESKKLKARMGETNYELIEAFLDYSLVKVTITTGIRHQIRCHLSSIGYPVAGDKLYQRKKHEERDWLNLKRHFLHASKIGFIHPASKKYVEFSSPLPQDLQRAVLKLKS